MEHNYTNILLFYVAQCLCKASTDETFKNKCFNSLEAVDK